MAAPCDEYPLLIMMEYYRRPGGDVKKSSAAMSATCSIASARAGRTKE